MVVFCGAAQECAGDRRANVATLQFDNFPAAMTALLILQIKLPYFTYFGTLAFRLSTVTFSCLSTLVASIVNERYPAGIFFRIPPRTSDFHRILLHGLFL